MDAAFPRNDIRATPCRASAGGWLVAAPHAGAASKTILNGLIGNDTSWDDVDEGCFLAAILEMEREERAPAGILGRWPFWEIRQWAPLNPERAETALGAGVIAAGVTLGVLWHVLSPHLAWLVPTAWR